MKKQCLGLVLVLAAVLAGGRVALGQAEPDPTTTVVDDPPCAFQPGGCPSTTTPTAQPQPVRSLALTG